MADRKQSQQQSSEFLGGGPKFNSVGRDTRGVDEPPVQASRPGLGRVLAITAFAVLLAGGLIYFAWSGQTPGKTTAPFRQGGQGVAPSDKTVPSADPNFK